ncbi:MAG: hypothetical protein Kow0029_06110 [Candidatus Rifleibacteriota bacterium]
MKFTARGSAYVLVLGAVAVLCIMVLAMINTNTNRSFSTRMLSNEKKAEAVVESAADILMAFVKKKANEPGSDFYHFFRMPAPVKTGKLYGSSGKNNKLILDNFPEITGLNKDYIALKPISSMIDSLGGEVNLEIDCRISSAEAFCDNKTYEVVGISKKANTAKGSSAKFLDSIGGGLDTDGSLKSALWAPSDWAAEFNLPSLSNTDSKTFSITVTGIPDIGSIDATVRIDLTKVGRTLVKYSISCLSPTSMPDAYTGEFDIEPAIKEYLSKDLEEVSIPGIRRMAMPDSDGAVEAISYSASKLYNKIQDEYNDVVSKLGSSRVKTDSFDSNTSVVEKGGIFEIDARIEYKPHGDKGEVIKRHLKAHMPFKVTDIQPIAPEYAFFVANANSIGEGTVSGLGGSVKLNSNSGRFIVHNVPEGNYKNITGFNVGGDDLQIPGMIRVNSNSTMDIKTFVGTLDEPDLTEFNVMTAPKVNPKFENIPVFQWHGQTVTRKHQIDFPVLFDPPPNMMPIIPLGIHGVKEFFSQGGIGIVETPSLLYGKCHMEYPLGIKPEGPLNMEYANAEITVKPYAEVEVDVDVGLTGVDVEVKNVTDLTKIYVKYQNKNDIPYGMVSYPAYSSAGDWSPNDSKNLPANCYSLMQHAKKSTYFYDSGSDFLNDADRKLPDGSYDINGVTYIKGALNINSDFKATGKGLIVAKTDIVLGGNVTKSDDSVLGLIARGGAIYFNCSEVHAACYSNKAPMCAGAVKIYGNLVANQFDRTKIVEMEIFYDAKACRASPLSIMRDVGKFAPERYFVSMSENWSGFAYEKILE